MVVKAMKENGKAANTQDMVLAVTFIFNSLTFLLGVKIFLNKGLK